MQNKEQIIIPATTEIIHNTVDERNEWLDSLINPDNTLPSVRLDFSTNWLGMKRSPVLAEAPDHSEINVGRVSITPGGTFNELGLTHIDEIVVEKGKGYGMATYLSIMKSLPLGQGMKSDDFLTEASYKVWRKLESLGVARSDKTEEEVAGTFIKSEYTAFNGSGTTSAIKFRTTFGQGEDEQINQILSSEKYIHAREQAIKKARELDRPIASWFEKRIRTIGRLSLHR